MARLSAFTIGYQGSSLPDFLGRLKAAGVERVVDVRALPLSRKRGFSKNALQKTLDDHGIEYVHLKAAGNPYRSLKDDPARALALYAQHLGREPQVLDQVEQAVAGRRCALLCFEARPEDCHRATIAEHLVRRGFAVTHL